MVSFHKGYSEDVRRKRRRIEVHPAVGHNICMESTRLIVGAPLEPSVCCNLQRSARKHKQADRQAEAHVLQGELKCESVKVSLVADRGTLVKAG